MPYKFLLVPVLYGRNAKSNGIPTLVDFIERITPRAL